MNSKLTKAILAAAALAALASCKEAPPQTIRLNESAFSELRVDTASFNGHRYVFFSQYLGSQRAVLDAEHDPDCPCKNKASKTADETCARAQEEGGER